jgi:hypothetical protein
MTVQLRALLLLVLFLLLQCCKEDTENVYSYRTPEASSDGWEVASAGDHGLKSSSLVNMMDYLLSSPGHQIHSILIIKDNKLVFEEYFEGYLYATNPPGSNGDYIQYDRETDHYLASVSKSITSVIFGSSNKG